MVNRPKDKGTWAETQVALYLRDHGWPYAERRALAGVTDKGDITGTPALAWEVKYANAGIRMGAWITETYIERQNAGADHAVLVIKPKGRGGSKIGDWLAVMLTWDFEALSFKALATSVGLTVHCSLESAYTGTTVLQELRDHQVSSEFDIPVLVRRPPGTKEKPEEWYRIMTLENMAVLLRAAGYGDPLRLRSEPTNEAQDLLTG